MGLKACNVLEAYISITKKFLIIGLKEGLISMEVSKLFRCLYGAILKVFAEILFLNQRIN